MKTLPNKFEVGLQEYCSIYSPDTTNIVVIPKQNRNFDVVQKHSLELLAKEGYRNNVHFFMPPSHVSPTWAQNREEDIPTIAHPEYGTILIDDSIDTGGTINYCLSRLSEQGIKKDRAWAMVGNLTQRIIDSNTIVRGPFLDKWEIYESVSCIDKIQNHH